MASRSSMRRKPSASNLFASIGRQGAPRDSEGSDAYSYSASTMTMPEGPAPRSGGGGAGAGAGPGSAMGSISVTGPESFSALVDKRTASWWYVRRAHDANQLWFHTVLLSRGDISGFVEGSLGAAKMQQRTRNLLILGLSLSAIFDIANVTDLLRALVKLLDDWDAWAEGAGGKGMKNLFRQGKGARRPTAVGEFSSGYQMDGETALMLVNLPFLPDYFETVISLCEIVRQVYIKLGLMLVPADDPASGPAGTPQTAATSTPHTAGASGYVPYPYRRVSEQAVPLSGTAPSAYNPPKSAGPGGGGAFGEGPRSASVSYGAGWKGPQRAMPWSPALCELIMKADGKLKKIMLMFTKELEATARKAVQSELISLLPGASAQFTTDR